MNIVDNYSTLLQNIKKVVDNTKNNIIIGTNKELIIMYYDIGLMLIRYNKWGSSFINKLSSDLINEFPEFKGMSSRNLRYMQKFAREYDCDDFLLNVLAKLSWYHNQILLDRLKDIKERKWYAQQCIICGWSAATLSSQINYNLYKRQAINEDKIYSYPNNLSEDDNKKILDLLKIHIFLIF